MTLPDTDTATLDQQQPLPLLVERSGVHQWRLQRPFLHIGSQGDTTTVETGYVTDFASVPGIVGAWRTGNSDEAAVVHDKRCDLLNAYYRAVQDYLDGMAHGWPNNDGEPVPPKYNSVDTDGAFRSMLRAGGAGRFKRWQMWVGVRWGALANPARRGGWWRTAPLVLLITAADLAAILSAWYGLHALGDLVLPGNPTGGHLGTFLATTALWGLIHETRIRRVKRTCTCKED